MASSTAAGLPGAPVPIAAPAPAPATGDARQRLPREPYPGLRPFLDFEAALLFGRERQVREVIDRLKATQFVAVLGGSGSGKSSLIHAGVMPALRSYGIPGAGDLWLPLTCTPGTNVSAADSAARRHTPITRLARRFAQLLRTRGSEAADQQRLADIADVFRQEAGFARLLDTFGAEIAVPAGPDPADARVLFVLDQFEEIFHPTNQAVDDARLLVERVLDHFFNPHERCHVVLTMRSEHLNDCAAYLELPDAINRSSYLVRRLDADELREAITGPAQRFLRLMARSHGDALALPEQVVFEEPVLERLMRDVQAITQDPDHLPLLQHLLARLWEAALEREEMDVPVPSRITEIDLVRAVNAAHQGDEQPLADGVNTLRASVENWPETLYRWHDAAKQEQFDNLFRHLAFKDPNTGLYSQQRIDVDAGARLLGPDATRVELRALIAEGFLGSVDYLFWDAEDPARVTLKVSHESFIRGWSRFRALVDAESAHFNEFLGVMRKAADWQEAERPVDDLLQPVDLRRLTASDFLRRVRAPEKRQNWRRLLALDRDGVRLLRCEPALDPYVQESVARQDEEQRRAARGKLTRRLVILATVLGALLPTALFSVLVQGPTMRRAELLFDAGNRANRATLSPAQAKVGDAGGTLDSLLRAAERVAAARTGDGSWRTELSRRVLGVAGGLPFFSEQRDFLGAVFTQAEPPVNGTLRQQLTGAVWRAAPPSVASGAVPLPLPDVQDDATCASAVDAEQLEVRGRLIAAPRRAGSTDGRPLRALFVPERPGFDRTLEVFSASVDPASGACLLGTVVLSSPEALDSRVVVDAGLRYAYYTVQGPTSPVPTMIVQEIDWERSSDGRVRALQRQTIATITDPEAVAAVQAVAGEQRAAVVPTWRVPGGRQVQVADKRWQIVATQAQRLEPPPQPGTMQPLRRAAAGSACARLAASFAPMTGFDTTVFESDSHCFTIARGWPALGDGVDPTRPARDELRVAVHERPVGQASERLTESPPAPVAGLVPFARVAPEDLREAGAGGWSVGTAGPYAGWLLLKLPDRADGTERHLGLPWSTCALWRMGRGLQQVNAPPVAGQAGGSLACETQP